MFTFNYIAVERITLLENCINRLMKQLLTSLNKSLKSNKHKPINYFMCNYNN